MSDTKRKPGRPAGSLNKVNIRADIQRAYKSGRSITQLKQLMEQHTDTVMAGTDGNGTDRDDKGALLCIKMELELQKHLHKLEIDFEGATGDEDDEASKEERSLGEVLNFGRK